MGGFAGLRAAAGKRDFADALGEGGEGGEERWKNRSIRVDLRNCSSLERLVGVRAAATEGRLTVDLRGCTSLPPSARPPMHR